MPNNDRHPAHQAHLTPARGTRGAMLLAALVLAASLLVLDGPAMAPVLSAQPQASQTPQPGEFRSYQALITPIIDGYIEDWPVLSELTLNSRNASYLTGSFSDDSDGSITCRSLWSAAALYIGCRVRDDQLWADNGAVVWKDDLVELAIDGKNDNVSFCGSVFCADDHKYELRVDGTVTDDSHPPSPPVTGAVATRSGGYSVELAIPRQNLAAGDLVAGKIIGFNLGLIDDDDGGETDGHLFWMGQHTWNHAEEYGDLVLDALSGTPVPTATRLPTPTPTPTATPSPLLPVDTAQPIACGQRLDGDTTAGANAVSSYGCVPFWPETGPERVYALTVANPTDVDVVLAGSTVDLDLFLVANASPASCLSYGDNSISLRGLAAGMYYLVVDGFDGAAGSYQLQMWCPLAPPDGPSPTPSPSPTPTPAPEAPHLYLPLLLES